MPYDAKKVAGQELFRLNAESMNVILFRDIDGKFATTTNGAIVKKSNGEVLPDDEPLFLLRARDLHAVNTLLFYMNLVAKAAERKGLDSSWQNEQMLRAINVFEEFRNEHPERMKQPGITRGK